MSEYFAQTSRIMTRSKTQNEISSVLRRRENVTISQHLEGSFHHSSSKEKEQHIVETYKKQQQQQQQQQQALKLHDLSCEEYMNLHFNKKEISAILTLASMRKNMKYFW